jgi:glucosamine--fructose-6-phosphate aminotransferase (isomerizing)
MREVLALEEDIKQIAKRHLRARDMLFLGRGTHFPIALEGALKLKEISYIHAEQEVKAREGQLIAVCTKGDHDIRKLCIPDTPRSQRGGGTEADVVEIPEAAPEVLPLLTILPLQLLSYYMADLKGTDVDQPRNLAKTVTVE